MTADTTHVFEKAGLGKAPFRCVAVASIPSPSLAERNPDAYNAALRELPRDVGCGTCNYCGTAIMHNFIIRSSDDRRFVVGSDCVAKTGDAGLIRQVKAEEKKREQVKRAAKRQAAAESRQAQWKAQREAQVAAFLKNEAALIEAAKPFMSNPFIGDVMGRALSTGFLSDRQYTAVKSAIEREIANAAVVRTSEHFGKIGDRVTLKVKVDRVASFDRPSFSGFGHETCWVITMRDEAGRAIVSKSNSFRAERGEELVIKATIKDHSEYNGEKQTIVQRVKALEVVS